MSSEISVAEVVGYLDQLLEVERFSDLGPNGLQVPGRQTVRTVVAGVSAQRELFERAAELGAGLILVHHGLLWDFQPRRLDRVQAERLRALLVPRIALAAYHLPLDAHPEHGNNALLAAGLGCVEPSPFAAYRGTPIGVAARFAGDGIAIGELLRRVATLTGREPLHQGSGPDRVRSIGIVSGGAAGELPQAIAAGLDAFLTGEPKEHVMADAREAGIHFIAAGHYATETLGIRRLGEIVAARFGLVHHFVEIPNPV